MAEQYSRLDRIGEYIIRKVSELLRTKCNDPRISMLVINKVIVAPDLGSARIMFGMMEDCRSKVEDTLKGLSSASGFLRSELAKGSTLKRFPRLQFVYDDKHAKSQVVRDMIDSLYPNGA